MFSFERLLAFRWPYTHRKLEEKRWLAILAVAVAAVLGPLQRLQYLVNWYQIYVEADILLQCGRHLDNFIKSSWVLKWSQVENIIRVRINMRREAKILSQSS